ncbi:MAG: hypothetical protein WCF94_03100 [bacterium]
MKFLFAPVSRLGYFVGIVSLMLVTIYFPKGTLTAHDKVQAVQSETQNLSEKIAGLEQKIIKMEIKMALVEAGYPNSRIDKVFKETVGSRHGSLLEGYGFSALANGQDLIGWYGGERYRTIIRVVK